MSFEIGQDLAATFKGTSEPPLQRRANVSDVDKKIESLTALKSYLKRNDVDVFPIFNFLM
jgi:hypothetical protein